MKAIDEVWEKHKEVTTISPDRMFKSQFEEAVKELLEMQITEITDLLEGISALASKTDEKKEAVIDYCIVMINKHFLNSEIE